MKYTLTIALAILTAAAAPVQAKDWTVDTTNSRLGFTGKQGDTPFDGSFKKFTANIDFDPAHPESGKIAATIDMASATTGTAERDGALPQSDWFDVKKFPQAEFTSTAIRAAHDAKSGEKCFEAEGTLTIKSVTKPVKLPFCLKPEGDMTRAQGELTLARSYFNIGLGQWATDAIVKQPVVVKIDIAARPGP